MIRELCQDAQVLQQTERLGVPYRTLSRTAPGRSQLQRKREDTRSRRQELLARQQGMCKLCIALGTFEVDHVIPVSQSLSGQQQELQVDQGRAEGAVSRAEHGSAAQPSEATVAPSRGLREALRGGREPAAHGLSRNGEDSSGQEDRRSLREHGDTVQNVGLVAQTRKTAEQALQCHLAGHQGIDSTRYHRSGGASTSERPGGASRGGVKPRDLPCERAQINERENRRLEASRGRMRRKPCRSGLLIRAGGQRKAVRNLEEESAWN